MIVIVMRVSAKLPVTTIREIKLLKYLQHKNLVRLVEVIAAEDDDDDEGL